MNRTELVAETARRSGLPAAQVQAVVDAVEGTVVDALGRGEKVQLPGFLTFDNVERQARSGRNPRTGEALTIPARRAVTVSAGKRLKDAVREER